MGNTVIEVKKLEKQYGKQKVVQDLSFRIEEGMICGLIGPNGAGKTTIMKMLGGLVLPTGGEMELFGGSTEKELAKARSRISFMIETPYAKEKMTARENLEKQRIQKGIPDKKRVDEVLKLVASKCFAALSRMSGIESSFPVQIENAFSLWLKEAHHTLWIVVSRSIRYWDVESWST